MLPYDSEEEMKYMSTHPPACIGNICIPALDDVRELILAEYGNNTTVFGTKCSCGANEFILGIPEETGEVNLTCLRCESRYIIFDPELHGYSGALRLFDEETEDELIQFECSECTNERVKITTAYQYAGETDILNEDDAPEINPEELFGWYIVCAECSECGNIEVAYEAECA